MTDAHGHPSRDVPQNDATRHAAEGVRTVSSNDLLRGQRLLLIRHGADAYRLQLTQGGKLILTK